MHQHIFKVGWLVTKNFQTTTILYYTFFLPGIIAYEATLWLVAGALDVRAQRAIAWPEPQEIGELRLNFVQLSRRASPWKIQVINLSPLLTGMILIWYIGIEILHLADAVDTMRSGGPGAVLNGIRQLTRTSDFWLWAYFLFAIGNTMLPHVGIIKNWRWAAVALVIVSLPFFLLGVQDQFVGGTLTGPIASILEVMLIIFSVIIVFNALGVAILSAIENSIEYVTGDSATFRNGKMIVMTREEAIAERRRERENARRQQSRASSTAALPRGGPPSIYKIEFPIPSGPGKEPVTSIPTSLIEPNVHPTPGGGVSHRDEPSIVTPSSRREHQGHPEDRVIRFGGTARDETHTDEEFVTTSERYRVSSFPGRPLPPPKATSESQGDKAVPQRTEAELSTSIRPASFSRPQQQDNVEEEDEGEISFNTLRPSPFQRSPSPSPNISGQKSSFPQQSAESDNSDGEDEIVYEDVEDES